MTELLRLIVQLAFRVPLGGSREQVESSTFFRAGSASITKRKTQFRGFTSPPFWRYNWRFAVEGPSALESELRKAVGTRGRTGNQEVHCWR